MLSHARWERPALEEWTSVSMHDSSVMTAEDVDEGLEEELGFGWAEPGGRGSSLNRHSSLHQWREGSIDADDRRGGNSVLHLAGACTLNPTLSTMHD